MVVEWVSTGQNPSSPGKMPTSASSSVTRNPDACLAGVHLLTHSPTHSLTNVYRAPTARLTRPLARRAG